jgi:hypothetical protein
MEDEMEPKELLDYSKFWDWADKNGVKIKAKSEKAYWTKLVAMFEQWKKDNSDS